ncbi:MAG: AcvB/VirJ family lysyl-phosphatidylglycerol hydrolase [Amaricoccus sp.]
MRFALPATVLAFGLAVAGAARAADFDTGQIPHPTILLPHGPATQAIMLLSSEAGWSDADAATAEHLRAAGAAVVGIDLPTYLAALDDSHQDCVYLVADFERLSHALERATGATSFHAPIVAGAGEGGALAIDILAQTPADTLGGAIAVDPAAGQTLKTDLCTRAARSAADGGGSFYGLPAGAQPAPLTVVLSGQATAASVARADALAAAGVTFDRRQVPGGTADVLGSTLRAAVPPATDTGDAPAIVELPATPAHDTLAIMISGDGGWRDIDKQIAGVLQSSGVPTVGLDALRWFWTMRTPQETAQEIARLVDTYTAKWGVSKVLLTGYSFGADVLPETYLALPPEIASRVVQVSLLAPSRQADWQITVSGWLGSSSSKARPTGAALARMPPAVIQCIQGEEEDDSACPALEPSGVERIVTRGGHHFDGDYKALAARILAGLAAREAPAPTAAAPAAPASP